MLPGVKNRRSALSGETVLVAPRSQPSPGETRTLPQNLSAILAAAGGSLADVIKVSAHLTDLLRDFEGFDRVYKSFLTPPYPVRTTVGATLWHDYLIDIDVVACIPLERQPSAGDPQGNES
jgi:enamine deaminase RidA (YjgF/YER057c/UK114 family)